MRKIYCDVCDKEIKHNNPLNRIWADQLFIDKDDNYIADICEECFKTILCCVNMMKYAKWRPDYHEVLRQDDIWARDMAGFVLCDIEEKFCVEL